MYPKRKAHHSDKLVITGRIRGCRVDSLPCSHPQMSPRRHRLFRPCFMTLKHCIYDNYNQDKRVVISEKKMEFISWLYSKNIIFCVRVGGWSPVQFWSSEAFLVLKFINVDEIYVIGNIVMTELPLLAVPKSVKMTTSGATSPENFVKITLPFQ